MKRYHLTLIILFVFFALATPLFLTRVPGLLGDEASEGENVYQILNVRGLTVEGERSYIGPFIDYVRIPFILLFGYTPLALRAVLLLASWVLFAVTAWLLGRQLGEDESLVPLATLFFSPMYILYQRLGWGTTLTFFFALLLVAVLFTQWRHKALLAGLVAGLGLHNHILFLPSLAGITVVALVFGLRRPRQMLMWWPAVVGFAAGFGTQAAVLMLQTSDQGSAAEVARTVGERWQALPSLLPGILAGSSFIAAYTGHELAPFTISFLTYTLFGLATVALLFSRRRLAAWAVAVALGIHLMVLLRMIDRYSLRYFVVFALGIWFLAGMGLEAILDRLRRWWPPASAIAAVAIAAVLLLTSTVTTLLPFLRTGGAVADFSLGNRTDSAAAFVDTRQLQACVHGLGVVYSENVHVYNRLLFLSHQDTTFSVPDEDHKKTAAYLVDYRIPAKKNQSAPGDVCPELEHFRITN